jgi:hypothetical protein
LQRIPVHDYGHAGMTEPCTRRGTEVWPGFFRCDSNRLMHPEPGVVAIGTCGICPYRNLPDQRQGGVLHPRPAAADPREAVSCAHRGDVIDRGVCNVCGMKGQEFHILACALHGRCMVRRYRNDRPGLKVCVACIDFEAVTASSASHTASRSHGPAIDG